MPPPGPTSPSILATAISGPIPVALALGFHRILVSGHGGTLQVRLENRSAVPAEDIEIRLRSRGWHVAPSARLRHLGPALARTLLIEIEPERPGNFVLTVELRFRQGGRLWSFRADTSVNINAVPETGNISLQLGDILVNQGTNAGLGMDRLEISNLLGNHVRTLNDLLNVSLPEHFRELELTEEYDVDEQTVATVRDAQAGRLTIPGGLERQPAQTLRLRLRPESSDLPLLRFTASPDFLIGRDLHQVDHVSWFLPRSARNDEKTRHLSKLHVRLRHDANRIWVQRATEYAVAFWNGVPIPPTDALPMEDRGTLTLGDDFPLDVTLFPAGTPLTISGQTAFFRAARAGAPSSASPSAPGAARITTPHQPAGPWRALWVLADAAFGTSAINPLPLDHSGLGEVQGRFHHHAGGFWIENSLGNGAVRVQGTTLTAAQIVPLHPGMSIVLGNARYTVEIP